ncbi:MAG: hypothetical protein U0271_27705 [Polyangiaceae bacterium]
MTRLDPPVRVSHVKRNAHNRHRLDDKQWFVDYLPITGGNKVTLLVDGENYGKALLADLEAASGKNIMLTGLHFDPGWVLDRGKADPAYKLMSQGRTNDRRYSNLSHKNSLVNVLKRAAERGCHIHLIVNQFWEDEAAVLAGHVWELVRPLIVDQGNLGWYLPLTLELFRALSHPETGEPLPHIYCRTDVHPRSVMSTHHQKTVIIGNEKCFVGGIDMTAVDGDRWDRNSHEIPGTSDEDRREYDLPEHLWHDVHCRVEGPAVQFVLDNFHARWNHGRLFRWKAVTRHKYQRVGWGIAATPVKAAELIPTREGAPTFERDFQFLRLHRPPDCAYQETSREVAEGSTSLHTIGHVEDRRPSDVPFGAAAWNELPNAKIQVVRSMPAGPYDPDRLVTAGRQSRTPDCQKPYWNISTHDWERSTKDAYIVGIRAAEKYIYLENQWVSDQDIWFELACAMRRNKRNPNFRIVVVIPRRPLEAAGFGRHQDVDLEPHIEQMIDACKDEGTHRFGIYCLVQPIPTGRRSDILLSEADKKDFGETEAQIYVHSKIMIVDDRWSLIGSANAGGISLLGLWNPDRAFRDTGSTPDSELSVIVYDDAFAKHFRETLWTEHLGSAPPGTPHAGADLFRANAESKVGRLRNAGAYRDVLTKSNSASYAVLEPVLKRLRASARLIRTLSVEDQEALMSRVSSTDDLGAVCKAGDLEPDSPLRHFDSGVTTFTVDMMKPPPIYEVQWTHSLAVTTQGRQEQFVLESQVVDDEPPTVAVGFSRAFPNSKVPAGCKATISFTFYLTVKGHRGESVYPRDGQQFLVLEQTFPVLE